MGGAGSPAVRAAARLAIPWRPRAPAVQRGSPCATRMRGAGVRPRVDHANAALRSTGGSGARARARDSGDVGQCNSRCHIASRAQAHPAHRTCCCPVPRNAPADREASAPSPSPSPALPHFPPPAVACPNASTSGDASHEPTYGGAPERIAPQTPDMAALQVWWARASAIANAVTHALPRWRSWRDGYSKS